MTVEYATIQPQIRKAREDAVNYMNLTPNEIAKDTSRFQKADGAASSRTPILKLQNNQPNLGRFSDLINYLSDTLHKLGDYH